MGIWGKLFKVLRMLNCVFVMVVRIVSIMVMMSVYN